MTKAFEEKPDTVIFLCIKKPQINAEVNSSANGQHSN